MKKRIIKAGIDTTHFTGQGWNRGSINYKTDEAFAEGSTVRRTRIRDWIIRDHLIPYECSICGNTGEWMGKPMALELDHINGVFNDHRLENLRFLCPNCHATTDTYCGRNKRNKKEKVDKKPKVFVPMPPAIEIASMIVRMNKTDVAKYYNVSCSTIDRWCKKQGVPHQMYALAEWGVQQYPTLYEIWEKRKLELLPDNWQKSQNNDGRRSHGRNVVNRFCKNCGKPLKTNSDYCQGCSQRRVKERPSAIEIAQKVKEKGFWRGAKDYGVTDNAVRKWCKDYGIPIHTKDLISWLDSQDQ